MTSSVRRTILEKLFPAAVTTASTVVVVAVQSSEEEVGNATKLDDEETGIPPSSERPMIEYQSQCVCDGETCGTTTETSRITGEGEQNRSGSTTNDTKKLCSICLERLGTMTLIRTACDHLFHRECILNWIANTDHNNSCPTCRYKPLYNVEKYNALLLADHPDFGTVQSLDHDATTPTATGPTGTTTYSTPTQNSLVHWIVFALVLQITVMSAFIYGMDSSSSSTSPDEMPYPYLNLSMSCANVSIPFDELDDTDEIFCIKTVLLGSCTICNIMEPEECLCYCRDELRVLGIQYTNSSKCCKCVQT